MLVNLHVRNFAIIDETDIDFGNQLNILTGETGAGKSILVGSINIALGARVSSDMIGQNGDYAMVEAVFQIDDEETLDELKKLDIEPEDGQLVISRKITENRSINKINGESVSVNVIRNVANLCIDIHSQHENQSLMRIERHREIVDAFGENSKEYLKNIQDLYKKYNELKNELESNDVSEKEKARRISILEYERDEIENANLSKDEIESIDENYKKISNSEKISTALSEVENNFSNTILESVGRSIQRLRDISDFDENIQSCLDEFSDIENMIMDANRDLLDLSKNYDYDPNELMKFEARMDQIHTLQAKYGESYEQINSYYEDVLDELDKFADYEKFKKEKQEELDIVTNELEKESKKLSEYRKKNAKELGLQISKALEDLNFSYVDFEIEIRKKDGFSSNGIDEIEFMIATNPGQERKSLGKIVSGGELSRIMLAIKSVFAKTDSIDTLIFDEIDTGISGKTAQLVAQKMKLLSKNHQIICITHLPQIASAADTHFIIEKEVGKDASRTSINKLSKDDECKELARMLGGAKITETVLENAKEMKMMWQGK